MSAFQNEDSTLRYFAMCAAICGRIGLSLNSEGIEHIRIVTHNVSESFFENSPAFYFPSQNPFAL